MNETKLNNYYLGKKVMIHAYKFNGWLYRTWDNLSVIKITDDYVICAGKNTPVLSSEYLSPRVFKSYNKNQSFWMFFKNEWFNMLVNIIDNRPSLYINVASKFIYEESTIKYIDFDLDFKVQVDGSWVILDQKEFTEAIDKYKYPDNLVQKIRDIAKKIEGLIKRGELQAYFTLPKVTECNKLYEMYCSMKDEHEDEH